VELEVSSKDLAAELKDLSFCSAREIDGAKKTIVIFVPFRQHKKYQKIQARLVRELEKKFSGKHVIIIAQRTILSPAYKRTNPGQQRPRNRTLTAVHNSILEDVVYPTQIVGKRTRFRTDGSRLLKIFLDPKDLKEVDHKVKTFATVYKKLTNKDVEFTFPPTD